MENMAGSDWSERCEVQRAGLGPPLPQAEGTVQTQASVFLGR